ncbi:MAG: hypothetical protein MUE34_01165 [Acidimicrobiales bacterium]|nr:hypothetical protein [Acidimicrobiales bacterium]
MKTRLLALFGLVMMLPIGLGLVRGDLGLDQAGMRTAVLLVVLAIVDRVVVPIVRTLVGPPARAGLEAAEAAKPSPGAEAPATDRAA